MPYPVGSEAAQHAIEVAPRIWWVGDVLDGLITRPDAVVLTEWRSEMLLRHLGIHIAFASVEDYGWTLPSTTGARCSS